jgi:tetratricopeptide (TPR) repeat protein
MTDDNALRFEAAEEGAELLREEKVEEALRELTALAERDPENEYAHFFLGNAYYEKQDWGRALKCYVRALDLAPRYIGAMVSAAHSLRMMGRFDQALRMAKQAQMIDREDSDVLYLLGVIQFQRDQKNEAIDYLQRFLKTNPELEVGLEVQGMLQVLQGDVVAHPNAEDGGDS